MRKSGQMVAVVGVALLAVWWLAISPPDGAGNERGSIIPPESAGSPAAEVVPPDPSKPVAQPSPLIATQAPSEQQPQAEPVKAPAVTAVVPTRQGPVDALSKRFAGESRAATSDQDDARVRAAFSDPAIPPDMLHSVECRRSVCRAQLRWTAQRDPAYVLGLTRAVGSFSQPLGIEGAGTPDVDGVRLLVVYFGVAH